MAKACVPVATYRFQFNSQFKFQQATELVSYLNLLGISHCYASPILCAKSESPHGYDIIDHTMVNPEIGTEAEFLAFVQTLRTNKLGLIFDMVPNHMYIADAGNRWWNDVLENGPASPYADFFDIYWHSHHSALVNKVLLPLLDQQYGEALENQKLKVTYREGAFYVELPFVVFPTDPKSWSLILGPLEKDMKKTYAEDSPQMLELESILTALSHLPKTTDLNAEKIVERLREKEIIKRRLDTLISKKNTDSIHQLLSKQLDKMNGEKGNPRSFDDLEAFLNNQPYRLSFWRVANDEINYRRFFDIFELAGIKTEKKEVFDSIHALLFSYVKKGLIDGIRIDHIDGLWDPEQYLQDLQAGCMESKGKEENQPKDELFYVIAEKILIGNEKLLNQWQLYGTVGYDFLNQLNGLFVNQPNKKAFSEIYKKFTGFDLSIFDLIYRCKKLILTVSMSSELYVLTRHLDRISEQHRNSRDFTTEGLRAALKDVIACFPVYRTYIRGKSPTIHEEDRQSIMAAIYKAKRLNPSMSASIFDFIQSVLLLEHPSGLETGEIKARENFVMRFQQITGPVMAKGMEDTAFYQYFPLASLYEVGADPYGFGISVEAFHKKNIERFAEWPHTLCASSTHDTKRSEDVRARINVLSEIPEEWEQAIERWNHMNLQHKVHEGEELIPDMNEEYLVYQTLLGAWPFEPMDALQHEEYEGRIHNYMEKAIKEAKIHSSWVNPNSTYDTGVKQFVQKLLAEEDSANPFLEDFKPFAQKIARAGMLNSLSQVLLKITSPGVPDIYQGNEIWDLSLVDPDNRRPVYYKIRKEYLQEMDAKDKAPLEILRECMGKPEDGRIKMYVTIKSLRIRQKLKELFSHGAYVPLSVQGAKENHVIAFARLLENKTAIVIATRFFADMEKDAGHFVNPPEWQDTFLILPEPISETKFLNAFTGAEIQPVNSKAQRVLSLQEVLDPLHIAFLESIEG